MSVILQMTVNVPLTGNYYGSTEEAASQISGWIQGALDDRDDIDVYGEGFSVELTEVFK